MFRTPRRSTPRVVVASAFGVAAVAGVVLLALPHGPVVQTLHADHAQPPVPAVMPPLGYDPDALTRDLAAAVARQSGVERVDDARLLFHERGGDGSRAALTACVTASGRATTAQVVLRDSRGGWRVEQQTDSGSPC